MKKAISIKDLPAISGPGGKPAVLAHICCGPCSVMPLKSLLEGQAEVSGFFHNPNIHPLSEFRKRLEAAKELARHLSLDVIFDEEYRPSAFLKGMREHAGPGFPEFGKRCGYCYYLRLEAAARTASGLGFPVFTSSLLYSRYQDHEAIRSAGVELAAKYGILFLYEDFRPLWQDGVDASRALGLYRQKYCGCIYSKMERYSKKAKAASKNRSFS